MKYMAYLIIAQKTVEVDHLGVASILIDSNRLGGGDDLMLCIVA